MLFFPDRTSPNLKQKVSYRVHESRLSTQRVQKSCGPKLWVATASPPLGQMSPSPSENVL